MAPSVITPTEQYNSSYEDFKSIDKTFGTTVDHGAGLSKQLIGEALKSRVEALDPDTCDAGDEDTFFVADLGEVYRQHMRWKKNLARVKPHYGQSCPQLVDR
jgi:ornithine decarboxylase